VFWMDYDSLAAAAADRKYPHTRYESTVSTHFFPCRRPHTATPFGRTAEFGRHFRPRKNKVWIPHSLAGVLLKVDIQRVLVSPLWVGILLTYLFQYLLSVCVCVCGYIVDAVSEGVS
jgi:hypothetical protein